MIHHLSCSVRWVPNLSQYFWLKKLSHKEIKWLRDEVPSHTGSKWQHHDSSSDLPNTNTKLFWVELMHMVWKTIWKLLYTSHGQISLQYKEMCYTLYKCMFVNVYIQGDLPFSLPDDKTWRITVSVTHELQMYFFHFADPGMLIYLSSAWELQCIHS